LDRFDEPHENHVLLQESAVLLLWHLKSGETLAIDKLACSMNRLVPWLGFEGDVFDCSQVYLQWVQLLAVKVTQKWSFTAYVQVQILD